MGNVHIDMEILKYNQKEMLEIKNYNGYGSVWQAHHQSRQSWGNSVLEGKWIENFQTEIQRKKMENKKQNRIPKNCRTVSKGICAKRRGKR